MSSFIALAIPICLYPKKLRSVWFYKKDTSPTTGGIGAGIVGRLPSQPASRNSSCDGDGDRHSHPSSAFSQMLLKRKLNLLPPHRVWIAVLFYSKYLFVL